MSKLEVLAKTFEQADQKFRDFPRKNNHLPQAEWEKKYEQLRGVVVKASKRYYAELRRNSKR